MIVTKKYCKFLIQLIVEPVLVKLSLGKTNISWIVSFKNWGTSVQIFPVSTINFQIQYLLQHKLGDADPKDLGITSDIFGLISALLLSLPLLVYALLELRTHHTYINVPSHTSEATRATIESSACNNFIHYLTI